MLNSTQLDLTPKQNDAHFFNILTQLNEGQFFEHSSGKNFTKFAGLIAAHDIDTYNWLKSNVSTDFFNTYVVRIVLLSPGR